MRNLRKEKSILDLQNVKGYTYVDFVVEKEKADMSITLSIPHAVVQEARTYAAENGTTMSRLIREYFINLVSADKQEPQTKGCRFLELADAAGVRLPKGWRFNRSECYERVEAK